MPPLPKIIVYKTIECDLVDLQRACKRIGFACYVAKKPNDFKKEINKGSVVAIVVPVPIAPVPLGLANTGSSDGNVIIKFCSITENILRPEDAYVKIIYSTEGFTPAPMPQNYDPRPVKCYVNDPDILIEDRNWQKTIRVLESLKENIDPVSYSVPNRVIIEGLEKAEVPFPVEALFLLRAAFNNMSKIDIKFPPKQGLSGSIACIVQPYDRASHKCALFFAKIYPDERKANSELQNLKAYFNTYIPPQYYAHYQTFRRCKGHAFSIGVTDLAIGPNNSPLSFNKMMQSSKHSVTEIESFITEIISVLDIFPINEGEVKLDLFKEYLEFSNAEREKLLNSENICRKWFENIAGPEKLIEKIKATLPPTALESNFQRVCHGDMHGENIMVKKIGRKLSPFFIDYSHVEYQHGIKDLVTLEADIVIRGLEGIEVTPFLNSLERKYRRKRARIDKRRRLLVMKSASVIRELRKMASSYGVSVIEYFGACLLKTLSILSYRLPFDQNQRADLYIKYLLGKIKKLSKV